jgi:hypothetical protein
MNGENGSLDVLLGLRAKYTMYTLHIRPCTKGKREKHYISLTYRTVLSFIEKRLWVQILQLVIVAAIYPLLWLWVQLNNTCHPRMNKK